MLAALEENKNRAQSLPLRAYSFVAEPDSYVAYNMAMPKGKVCRGGVRGMEESTQPNLELLGRLQEVMEAELSVGR